MEQLGRVAEKLIDIILGQAGFGGMLIFLGLCFFVFMYFREKGRNKELTNLILEHSEKHSDKFVDIVTDGIEADNRLALTISQLTSTITDIKQKLDLMVSSHAGNTTHKG